MSLKFTGQFGPITGAMKTGDAPPLFTPSVWSPTLKTSDFAISGDDGEIITNNTGGSFGGIVSDTVVTTGKFYWEIQVDFINGGGQANELTYGVTLDGGDYPNTITGSSFFNTGGDPWGGKRMMLLTRNTARANDHGVTTDLSPNIGPAAAGHTYGFAFDADNRYMWAHRNGVWISSGSISAVETGVTTSAIGKGNAPIGGYRAVLAHNATNVSASWTCTTNFGQNAFAYTVPTGFTEGFGL